MAKKSLTLFGAVATIVAVALTAAAVGGGAITAFAANQHQSQNGNSGSGNGQQGQPNTPDGKNPAKTPIVSIEKTQSQDGKDTYTITYESGETSQFDVEVGQGGEGAPVKPVISGVEGDDGYTPNVSIGENGNWIVDGYDTNVSADENLKVYIVSIEKTSSDGLVDTYTITYSDGKTSTLEVKNGENGVDGLQGEKGADGTSMRAGHGQPAADLGQDGDSYVDLDSWDFYVKKDGAWTANGNIKGESGISYTVTPEVGDNGNWHIGGVDTGVVAEPGQEPYVGEDGNWHVGETNLNVEAVAEKGEKGDKGDKGASLLIGHGEPDVDLGAAGDSYIDTDTWTLYAKSDVEVWEAVGTFKGSDGSGAPGVTPHVGENGNWFIGDEDTGVHAQGEEGNTPVITIGANGNWFVDDVDTGVRANAYDGANGKSLFAGEAAPADDLGEEGDSYVNFATGDYYLKTAAGWGDPVGNIKGTNGKSIVSVELLSSDGLVDTYQINYSSGDPTTFMVTNGQDGRDGAALLVGQGAPAVTLGANGDSYIDTETWDFYHKSEDAWTLVDSFAGEAGANGVTPHIGDNGNWFIGETDTGVHAQGEEGVTPHIGDNGNWFVGETDTGVKAQGPKGDAGKSLLYGDADLDQDDERGNVGDSYINTDNGNYFVKNDTGWELVTCLKGVSGRTVTSVAKGTSSDPSKEVLVITYSSGDPESITIDKAKSIVSVTKSTSGLVDTYTVNYNYGDPYVFTVTNGQDGNKIFSGSGAPSSSITSQAKQGDVYFDITNCNMYFMGASAWGSAISFKGANGANGRGITSITKTSTSGLVDTYTITYSDNTTSTFTVTNGQNGTNGTNGTSLRTGHGAPASSLGINGDSYIDLDTFDVYVKSSGAWNFAGNIRNTNPDYNPATTYTVTFVNADGTAAHDMVGTIPSQTVVKGEGFKMPALMPTKANASFQGFLGPNGGGSGTNPYASSSHIFFMDGVSTMPIIQNTTIICDFLNKDSTVSATWNDSGTLTSNFSTIYNSSTKVVTVPEGVANFPGSITTSGVTGTLTDFIAPSSLKVLDRDFRSLLPSTPNANAEHLTYELISGSNYNVYISTPSNPYAIAVRMYGATGVNKAGQKAETLGRNSFITTGDTLSNPLNLTSVKYLSYAWLGDTVPANNSLKTLSLPNLIYVSERGLGINGSANSTALISELRLGRSLAYIGPQALFSNCSVAHTVTIRYAGSETQWNAIKGRFASNWASYSSSASATISYAYNYKF